MLKYDCIKGVVMSDSFEQAWRVVKALPEQQAIHRRGPKQFRFADLSETGGADMGHGYESRGTVHPAILGMMARRRKADHDEYIERFRDHDEEAHYYPKPKTVEGILSAGDLDLDMEENYHSARGRSEHSTAGNELIGRDSYPPSFEPGWQDEVHPGSGEFEHGEMRDGQRPHWMSHPTRDERRNQ